ncbi:MAG: DnaB-like helicase C-terminal domain-containing protein [bacterium]|nr:DnaB-like helicase C-terminal domain-containing protein [bacterium]
MNADFYNRPAEKALLILTVRNPDYVRELGITENDFSPEMGRIWATIANAYANNRIVTDVELNTVAPESLVKEILYAPNMPYGIGRDFVSLLRQETDKRQMVAFAEKIYGVATSNSTPPTEKRPLVSEAFVRFLREGVIEGNEDVDYMRLVAQEFEQEYVGRYFRAISTGIAELDQILIIGKTGVYTFAARPGVGKTQFFLSWLWYMYNLQLRSFYSTVEVQAKDLAKRIINTKAQINPLWMALNNLPMTPGQVEKHKEAYALYEQTFNQDKRDPKLKVSYGTYFEDFATRLRSHHYRNPVNVVFLDHISMMRLRTFTGKPSDRHREVSDIMGQLNDISVELQVPICIASQISRGVEGRASKEPVLSDLKESASIEEVSHSTTFLFPDPSVDDEDFETLEQRPIVWKVAKSRSGSLGRGGLQFNAKIGTFISRPLAKKAQN